MISRSFGTTGRHVPVVGQGTWPIPDRDALRRGIELGLTHIDTAEMYGEGRSEEIVGEAIAPFARESLFIVSKVLPSNGTTRGVARACDRSLRRLKTEYLDAYLLHWRGNVDLAETMRALEALVDAGKIRSLGVSNLDPWDLREASAALRAAEDFGYPSWIFEARFDLARVRSALGDVDAALANAMQHELHMVSLH